MKTSPAVGSDAPETIARRLEAIGAAAVIRMQEPEKLVHVAEALHVGGISAIEVTMTVPNAIDGIKAVRDAMGEDVLLGVGSVLDAETARKAVRAGARFVVSPIFKCEIVQAAHELAVAALPGCFTPTEVQAAWEAGADIVKVFPAGIAGMKFIKAVRAPLPHLKLMPTGGVTLDNAADWLRAGAVAVGIGSALMDKQAVADENYARFTENARILRRNLDAAREALA